MNPTIIKFAPWIICVVLALMVAGIANAYLQERDEFTAYRTLVEALGKKATEDKLRLEAEYADNLKKVKKYEEDIPRIRADAIAAFRLRYPTASSCSLSGSTVGLKLHDDSRSKPLALDGFVQDCSEDANKVEQWRAWATLNGVPVDE